jgi:hypothetical protein
MNHLWEDAFPPTIIYFNMSYEKATSQVQLIDTVVVSLNPQVSVLDVTPNGPFVIIHFGFKQFA